MNENVKKYLAWGLVVVAILVAGFLGVIYPIPAPPVIVPAPAVAPAAPAVDFGAQAVEGRSVVISNTVAIAADSSGMTINWHRGSNPYTYADIYYAFDQETVNTTTLYLKNSYDGTTWFNYVGKGDPGITDGSAALVTANIADASGSMTAKVQWPYMRLYWDVANTEVVTVSARIYLR